MQLAKLQGICLTQTFPCGCAVLVEGAGMAGPLSLSLFPYLSVVLSWIWTRTWPGKRCCMLAGLLQPRLVMQLVTLRRCREGIQQRWQLLGLNLQLVPCLRCVFSQVSVFSPPLLGIS